MGPGGFGRWAIAAGIVALAWSQGGLWRWASVAVLAGVAVAPGPDGKSMLGRVTDEIKGRLM